MTKCCSQPLYHEPMIYAETKCQFGTYARCIKCYRLHGEANIKYTSPKGLRDSWTAYSEVMTREHFQPGESRPMRFEIGKAGLQPLGYRGAVTAEGEGQ